jgi:hypothetical protein
LSVYAELQERAKEDPDGVVHACAGLLDKNRDDAIAMMLMGQIYAEAERFGMAYMAFKRATEIRPEKSEGWNNLGMACEGMKDHTESMRHFQKAWSISKNAKYASNIGNTYLSRQDYDMAITWARKALQIDPSFAGAKAVLGLSSLALGDWATGWDNYEATLGGKFRKEVQYQEESRWDGTPGKTLVVYGEQGLGDEILYASCVPDAAKANRVILECDKRLAGLFRRSFPSVEVHGTRREPAPWLEDVKIDARVSCGTLPKFFRRKDSDFPGAPYLTADPERVLQWRALFDSWGKRPKIGIAWSGGSKHNKPGARAIGVDAFRSLIDTIDADWISLQYKDPTAEIKGLPIRHFPRAAESSDYDDTAGLVGALDMVIGVHTSAQHLAGALGVPGVILVPHQTLWLYENKFPWYASAKLFRQMPDETWKQTLARYGKSHTSIRRF